MNKIYKLKFDKCRQALVVVSEITTGTGKTKTTGHVGGGAVFRRLCGKLTPLSLLTGLILGTLSGMAPAADLPVGGQIVAGQGSIGVSGNTMTIQQRSRNMAADWQSFDIGRAQRVAFIQPDSSAVALNRVTGSSASQILGTLDANGRVFLVNPNGVVFGRDASVNTAGLVATTKSVAVADFMRGEYTLRGESDGTIINQGSLTTGKNGFIVLAADQIRNTGTLRAEKGQIALTAANTVRLQLDNSGLAGVTVNGSVVNALVDNQGLISAPDGQVYLTARGKAMLLKTVVRNSGTTEAQSLSSRGGQIRLDGGESGVVSQTGQLRVDSAAGQGGDIVLEGQNIYLAAGSRTTATGETGGGTVKVGGGWKGQDSTVKQAAKVVMDNGAGIDVSAGTRGDGGTAVLWSEQYTDFQGTIAARGGKTAGNGGQVETSSRRNLQAFGEVTASAPAGRGGMWLLDPADVEITSEASNTSVTTLGKGGDVKLDSDIDTRFQPSGSGAKVSATKIQEQLNNGTDVTVETSGFNEEGKTGNITVNTSISKSSGEGAATLTLRADNNIVLNSTANITASTGKLNLKLLAAETTDNSSISLNGNNISLNGGDFYAGPAPRVTEEAAIRPVNTIRLNMTNSTVTAGNITLDASRGLSGVNSTLNGTVGVMLKSDGNVSLNNASIISAADILLTYAQPGSLTTLNITKSEINATGNLTLAVAGGLKSVNANLTAGKNLTVTGPANITANNNGNVQWSAAKHLNITAALGDIMFSTNTSSNGNITLSGTEGIALTTRSGKVALTGKTGTNNKLILNSSAGDVRLSAANNDTAVSGSYVNVSAGRDILISGQVYDGWTNNKRGIALTGNSNLTAAGNIALTGAGNVGVYLDNDLTLNSTKALTISGRGAQTGVKIQGYNSNVSSFSGQTIAVTGTSTWKNTTGIELYQSSLNVNASGGTTLTGTGNGSEGKGIELSSKFKLNATAGALTLNGQGGTGIKVNGTLNVSGTNADLVLKGRGEQGDGNKVGVLLHSNSILKGANITLDGQGGTGVKAGNSTSDVDNSLNATGNVTIRGNGQVTGFDLTGLNLTGSTTNLTLSSAGSSASAVNRLGSKAFGGEDGLVALVKSGIENVTRVNVSGAAASSESSKSTEGKVLNSGKVNLVNLSKKIRSTETSATTNTNTDTVIDLTAPAVEDGKPAKTGGWAFSAVENISATTGNILLKGVAGFENNATLNASAGNITISLPGDFQLGNNASLIAGKAITLSTDGRVQLGNNINITGGADISLSPLTAGNQKTALLFTNNGKINATGNLSLTVPGGLSGYAYGLIAGKNLTITGGPVSASTGWGALTQFKAGERLNLTATRGDVTFNSMDTNNGGGNITLQAGQGLNITAVAGKVDLKTAGGVNNSLKIMADSGDIVIAGTSGNDAVTLNAVSVNATAGNIILTGRGSGNDKSAVLVQNNSSLKGVNITLDGQGGTGVKIGSTSDMNNTMNVTGKLIVRGNGRASGFDLTGLNLTIGAPANISLSSAGSAARAVNRLGGQAFGGENGLVALVKSGIENVTQVNVTVQSAAVSTISGDTAQADAVIKDGKVNLVNLSKKVRPADTAASAAASTPANTVVDLTAQAADGETAKTGGWGFNAVENITAETGDLVLKGVAGFENNATLNASAGNITISLPGSVQLGNSAILTAKKAVTIQSDQTVRLGENITVSGETVSLSVLSENGKAGLTFAGNGTVNATGNLSLNVAGGLTGGGYSLKAGGNLTVAGPVNASTTGQKDTTFSANKTLSITAAGGDVIFSNKKSGTSGSEVGGNLTLSAGEGIEISAADGKVQLAGSGVTGTMLNVTTKEGNITLIGKKGLSVGNATISGARQINLTAAQDDGIYVHNTNVTSTQSGIRLEGTGDGKANNGIHVLNSTLSAQQDLILNGTARNSQDMVGVLVQNNSSLKGVNVSLTGQGVHGVKVVNGSSGTLNTLNVTGGNLTISGNGTVTGFDLTGLNLTITDPSHLSLSSAGSAVTAQNRLGSEAFGGANGLIEMVKKGIEHATWVDVSSTSGDPNNGGDKVIEGNKVDLAALMKAMKNTVVDSSVSTEATEPSVINLGMTPSADGMVAKAGGWGFSAIKNITRASGDLTLQGIAGWGDGTVNASAGNVTIIAPQGGFVTTAVTGKKVAVNAGQTLNITATKGNLIFDNTGGGNITLAGTNGVTLETQQGRLQLKSNASNKLNVSSTSGNITLKNTVDTLRADNGIGVQVDNVDLNATTGNINITGKADQAVMISANSTVSASNVTLTGTGGKSGVLVTSNGSNKPTLNASTMLSIAGTGWQDGFKLSGLNGTIDVDKLTLSSAGSSGQNRLDKSVVKTTGDLVKLIKAGIDNTTRVNMSGVSDTDSILRNGKVDLVRLSSLVAKETTETTSSGNENNLKIDLTGGKTGGWSFDNMQSPLVLSRDTGDITVKGVAYLDGFLAAKTGNITLVVPNGGLTGEIRRADWSAGQKLSVTTSGYGNISLNNGFDMNLSGKEGVELSAAKGSLGVIGGEQRGRITSQNGTISFVSVGDTTLNRLEISSKGTISVKASEPEYNKFTKLVVDNSSLSSSEGDINLFLKTKGAGEYKYLDDPAPAAGVILKGNTAFSGKNIKIDTNVTESAAIDESMLPGCALCFWKESNISFNGNTSINATNNNKWDGAAAILTYFNNVNISVTGKMAINATSAQGAGIGYQYQPAQWANSAPTFDLKNNADLSITAQSQNGYGILGINKTDTYKTYRNFMVFKGNGNVSVNSSGETGIRISGVDNTALTGNVSIIGTGTTGNGIEMAMNAFENSKGIQYSGNSMDGVGFSLDTSTGVRGSSVNLQQSTITGTSERSDGIKINGDNITLTGGTVTGTAKQGNGSGVKLTGGRNYQLSGAIVTGTAVNGAGVSADGNLKVAANTVLTGKATGTGDGVTLSGTLTGPAASDTTTGTGTTSTPTISGTAAGGAGISFTGDTTLSGIALNGSATTGTGIRMRRSVVLDEQTAKSLKANSASGTGLSLDNADLKVVDSNNQAVTTAVSVSGTSANGTATASTGNSSLTGVTLSGQGQGQGTGVRIEGTLSMKDTVSGVSAQAQNNAKALVLKDALVKKSTEGGKLNVSATATGSSGVAVTLEGNNTLTDVVVKGNGTNGATGVQLRDTTLTAGTVEGTSDSGTGVTASGAVVLNKDTAESLKANSASGTGLNLNSANLKVVDSSNNTVTTAVKVSGTSENGTATASTGNSSLTGVTLSGQSKGQGTGVRIEGALVMKDTVSGVSAGAQSGGKALVLKEANLAANTPLSVSATATGASGVAVTVEGRSTLTNVTLNGSGKEGATGVRFSNATVTDGTVDGASDSGSGVITSGETTLTATRVSGRSGSGAGITQNGRTRMSRASFTGTSLTGQGVAVNGALVSDNTSVVTGSATAAGGEGVVIAASGSLNGGHVSGSAVDRPAVKVTDGASVTGTTLSGRSQQGASIETGTAKLDGVDVAVGGISLTPLLKAQPVLAGAINAVQKQSVAPLLPGTDSLPAVLRMYYVAAPKTAAVKLPSGAGVRQLALDVNKPVMTDEARDGQDGQPE